MACMSRKFLKSLGLQSDNNPSAGLQNWLHINRIPFNVSLHSAKDPSSSFGTARLGTFDSLEPVTYLRGFILRFLFPTIEYFDYRKNVRDT